MKTILGVTFNPIYKYESTFLTLFTSKGVSRSIISFAYKYKATSFVRRDAFDIHDMN